MPSQIDPKLAITIEMLFPRAHHKGKYKTLENGCWLPDPYTKTTEGDPYIKEKTRKIRIQELQWKSHFPHKSIPAKHYVKETCETRGCINPAHLAIQTLSQISQKRGKHKKGAENGRALLTEEQIKIIKKSKGYSSPQIAQHFNVRPGTIQDIRSGRNWKHIQPNETTPTLIINLPPKEEPQTIDPATPTCFEKLESFIKNIDTHFKKIEPQFKASEEWIATHSDWIKADLIQKAKQAETELKSLYSLRKSQYRKKSIQGIDAGLIAIHTEAQIREMYPNHAEELLATTIPRTELQTIEYLYPAVWQS
jgi:hypothetical protein